MIRKIIVGTIVSIIVLVLGYIGVFARDEVIDLLASGTVVSFFGGPTKTEFDMRLSPLEEATRNIPVSLQCETKRTQMPSRADSCTTSQFRLATWCNNRSRTASPTNCDPPGVIITLCCEFEANQ